MASNPDDGPQLQIDIGDEIPLGYPVAADSNLRRFLSAPQSQFDSLTLTIRQTKRDLQLPYASGESLDTLGWSKGILGKRRGRGDSEFRHFLQALPNAFGGKHRKKDIRKSISAAVVADEDSDVVLSEDVTTIAYSVTLESWQGHSTANIDFHADYADAPVVARTGAIEYERGTTPPRETGEDATEGPSVHRGTSPPRVTDTGGAWAVVEYEDGFSGFDFDSGARFDVEDPGESPLEEGVPAHRRIYVDEGETATADSPLSHDGILEQDGTIEHG